MGMWKQSPCVRVTTRREHILSLRPALEMLEREGACPPEGGNGQGEPGLQNRYLEYILSVLYNAPLQVMRRG